MVGGALTLRQPGLFLYRSWTFLYILRPFCQIRAQIRAQIMAQIRVEIRVEIRAQIMAQIRARSGSIPFPLQVTGCLLQFEDYNRELPVFNTAARAVSLLALLPSVPLVL